MARSSQQAASQGRFKATDGGARAVASNASATIALAKDDLRDATKEGEEKQEGRGREIIDLKPRNVQPA